MAAASRCRRATSWNHVMATATRSLLLSPGPTNVHDDVRRALLEPDTCHRETAFLDVLERLDTNLVDVLGGCDTHAAIPFVASGSGANEAVISSIRGRLLVLVAGPYSERLIAMAECVGIEVTALRFDPMLGVDIQRVEEAVAQDDRITHLFVVHCETTTGVVAPVHELGRLCQEHEILLAVDGISTVGAQPLHLQRDGIAFCVVSANKGLESVPGLSFVLARLDVLAALDGVSRSYYFDLHAQWRSLRDARQTRFTMATQLVHAAAAAVDRLRDEGYDQRVARYRRLRARLVEGLVARGLTVVPIPADRVSNLYVLLEQPGSISYAELHDALLDQGVTIYTDVSTVARGRLTLATMGAIDEADIDHFLELFSAVLDEPEPNRKAAQVQSA
jgi:2-aminoethylphosphonate-pyruvate transaminase